MKVSKVAGGWEVTGDWGELARFNNNIEITYHNFRYNQPIIDKMIEAILDFEEARNTKQIT